MSAVISSPSPLPLKLRMLNRLGQGLNAVGLARVSLDPAQLIARAQQKTGLDDFGPDAGWREGLERLVQSYEQEGRFTLVGRFAIREWLDRVLEQRLLLFELLRQRPEIREIPVEKPVFVVGFHRTGTTVLHNLLHLAPGCRAPLMWQLLYPCPPPDPAEEKTDPRVALCVAGMRDYVRVVPEIMSMHPIEPELPDECIHLMSLSFRHRVADAQGHCPSFMRWVAQQDLREAYKVHRAALQVLALRYPPARWMLKAPTHLWHLDDLLAEYPDAVIVQTHRHPAEVAASCCSLFEAAGKIYTDRRDPLQIGQGWLECWESVMPRALQARAAAEARGVRFIDLHFRDFRKDPAAQCLRLLDAIDQPAQADTEARLRAWLAANQRERHGDHRPTLERYGLSRDEISSRFKDYIQAFDL